METKSGMELSLPTPGELMRVATDVAGLCKQIALKTAVDIQGKKYVRVEGWQAIANAHGCLAAASNVEKVDGGIRAIGEIRRADNGVIICTAEGFVGDDEKTWAGRDEYARRAMAQTRAISRVCRSAFAHVVVMMDAGLSTTPAEEVPQGGFHDAAPAGGSSPSVPRDAEVNAKLPDGVKWQDVVVHFGKNKGTRLGDLEDKVISWYADKWGGPKLYNGKMDPADLMLKAAVTAWADEVSARQ